MAKPCSLRELNNKKNKKEIKIARLLYQRFMDENIQSLSDVYQFNCIKDSNGKYGGKDLPDHIPGPIRRILELTRADYFPYMPTDINFDELCHEFSILEPGIRLLYDHYTIYDIRSSSTIGTTFYFGYLLSKAGD